MLFRTHDSPVPTHTILGFEGSIATAPIDCTGFRSKTGRKVVPPLTDFQTPPLAVPANTVKRPSSRAASTAAMRPLVAAEPMLRAGRPEMVAASNLTGCCPFSAVGMKSSREQEKVSRLQARRKQSLIVKNPLNRSAGVPPAVAGASRPRRAQHYGERLFTWLPFLSS